MSTAGERNYDAFLASPVESLGTEIKAWFDIHAPEGVAKIAKACIALYNNNGGFLAVGISKDGRTDVANCPQDVRGPFSADSIQGIVSKYASRPFPVDVAYRARDGKEVVIIDVPSGVVTPCACKSDLQNGLLLKAHAVYVRTVHSNQTVSSSEARWNDWDDLVRRCFDNREADIGAFLRRHLSNINISALVSELTGVALPQPLTARESALSLLEAGHARFLDVAAERDVNDVDQLGWREVAVTIQGEVPVIPLDQALLWRLNAVALRQSGWPPWTILTRGSSDPSSPYVYNGGFEAFIDVDYGRRSIDFWRITPLGQFYHTSALEDDMAHRDIQLQPGTALDFAISISRVAEAISTAIAFAVAMGCDRDTTSLAIAFRWRNLRARRLGTWAYPRRHFWTVDLAVQNDVHSTSEVPLNTPLSGIAPYVNELTAPLFAVFGGHRFNDEVIEDIVRETVQRRL